MPAETTDFVENNASTSSASPLIPITREHREAKREIVQTIPASKSTAKKAISPISTMKGVDDDDVIELLLLDVQSEQSRFQEILTQLQDHSKKLLNLKFKRREARNTQLPLPVLSNDLHSIIRASLSSCVNIVQNNGPSAGISNSSSSLLSNLAPSSVASFTSALSINAAYHDSKISPSITSPISAGLKKTGPGRPRGGIVNMSMFFTLFFAFQCANFF